MRVLAFTFTPESATKEGKQKIAEILALARDAGLVDLNETTAAYMLGGATLVSTMEGTNLDDTIAELIAHLVAAKERERSNYDHSALN